MCDNPAAGGIQPPPPPREIKAINAAQDVGSEVIHTHTGAGAACQRGLASSERPAAEHRAQSTELSPQNSGRRRQPMLQSYFWFTNESLFDFKITKSLRWLNVLTYFSIIWPKQLPSGSRLFIAEYMRNIYYLSSHQTNDFYSILMTAAVHPNCLLSQAHHLMNVTHDTGSS